MPTGLLVIVPRRRALWRSDGPSAISFAPRSYPGLRRIVWAILCGTMVTTAVASAGVVKASLGASQVQREQTNKDRVRLHGIVNSVVAPVPDGVADAQRRVATATALRKTTCAPTRSLDLNECAKAKAEERKAADALASENTKREADLKAAEQRHRQDVAEAKVELDRLPVISLDQNVVAAGVNAIMPVADAWVDRGVVALWVLLFSVAPCAFLRLGFAILAPALPGEGSVALRHVGERGTATSPSRHWTRLLRADRSGGPQRR